MKDKRLFYSQRRFMFDSILSHISTIIDPVGVNNLVHDLEVLFLKYGNVRNLNYLSSVSYIIQDIARTNADIRLTDYQCELVAVMFNCSYASVRRAMSAHWKGSVDIISAMRKRCVAVIFLDESQIREIHDSEIRVL